MIRATTGHPARAFRGIAVLLALWTTYRAPEIERAFDDAVAAGHATLSRRAGPGIAASVASRPVSRRVAIVSAAPPFPSVRNGLPRATTVHAAMPARASVPVDRPPVLVSHAPGGVMTDPPFAAIPVPVDVPAPIALPPKSPTPGDLATAAYARLAAGDRRAAARLFDEALAAGADPRTTTWARERDRLTRRWSASAYSIVRRDGDGASPVTPVLGGAQSGVAAAWTIDPLARTPFAITARASVAHADRRSAIVAAGIAWRPRAGVVVAAERVVRPYDNRGDWTARVAAGGERRIGPFKLTGYAEAGFVSRSTYAAAQARAGITRGRIVPGIGVWTSVANGGGLTFGRVDVGPGIAARAGPFAAAADYRFRVAGNAAPGSGPVLTLSAAF